jgi:cytoskeletal protein RodZ
MGGGFMPPQQPPSNNGGKIALIIGAVVVVVIALGVGGFFLLRSVGHNSADDNSSSESSSSSSESSSSEELPSSDPYSSDSSGDSPLYAQEGDCVDNPSDVADTKKVDCSDPSAYGQINKRIDDPASTDNTQEAAAKECEAVSADYDYTLYILDPSQTPRFVLCIKNL